MENKEALKQDFLKVNLLYQRLSFNITESLKFLLKESEIPYLDVYSRVKDFDSFFDKIDRKQYEKPFDQIEDICGLRIVCYYPSDVLLIKKIIGEEFVIVNSEDKVDNLEPDKFGYRSHHFVVTLKNEWLNVPNYRGLEGIKAEIQVRTILMHAWADISHKLSYKKKEHIPEVFKRNLFQLSALFEIADDRFEMLRAEREEYRGGMINNGHFNLNQELNLDSLQGFLDFNFPDRVKDNDDTVNLLDELMEYGIYLEDLSESYSKVQRLLPELEHDIFLEGNMDRGLNEEEKRWTQCGVVRNFLDLTNDQYWADRRLPDRNDNLIQKQRDKMNNL
ncbi:hypothetical protein ACM7Q1_12755 [Paenibacillus illinoisensis]|uniref:hypothetical protein n=1 Tax=Paenibacillus illinoisensis TaxID=59845 RepID=UPI003A4E1B4B